MGLPSPEIDSALRLSFCYENTEQDIRQFLDALEEAMPLWRVKAAEGHS